MISLHSCRPAAVIGSGSTSLVAQDRSSHGEREPRCIRVVRSESGQHKGDCSLPASRHPAGPFSADSRLSFIPSTLHHCRRRKRTSEDRLIY